MEKAPKTRKHRATGEARGGVREGAGRKEGTKNTLGYGEVKATKAAKLRVPEALDEDSKRLAAHALQRIVDVMDGDVHAFDAGHVLKAATHVRLETCGPVTQKVEHSFSDMTDEQLETRYRALTVNTDGGDEAK